MLLTHTDLLDLVAAGVILGVPRSHINGASIDVTLGSRLWIEAPPHGLETVVDLMAKAGPHLEPVDLLDCHYYDLSPGQFCLGGTEQIFHLPNDISAEFRLKSSAARAGLDAALAMWCLTGETEIPLLDGTTRPIADLVGKQTWVYATDGDGRVVPGFASRIWHTKDATELAKVHFDDGSTLTCTPEHLLRLRNGAWVAAGDLQVGAPVMAVPRRANAHNVSYETVYSPTKYRRHWTPTHEIVDRYLNGPLPRGQVVHHLDHNPVNNHPDNLARMTLNDHLKHHHADLSPERLAALSQFRSAKASKENQRRWANADNRKKMSEWAKSAGVVQSLQSHRAKHGEDVRLSTLTGCVKAAIARLVEAGRPITPDAYLAVKRQNAPTIATLEAAFGSFSRAVTLAGYENHRVIGVERITPESPIPVYDMTVDTHHNFVLSNGVVAHNCDPTWSGSVLTLELTNALQWHALRLRPGLKVGQMIFHRGAPVPEHAAYARHGSYNNDLAAQPSKGIK